MGFIRIAGFSILLLCTLSRRIMKIKKLSILGFKSIMDRLELSFPGGISGIVGPNGCGKSNIVDAIRWVLGEQSARQLRGREMQDVIFNGAGEFKQLGMAEVTIVFENGDGSFPSSFEGLEELAVTRRLYRSGESEYLLNSMPCRLKDIQEVFMDTGLGNKAYSVIGQGKIGAILEQRPEETRAMLEEAAGITKYRRKVEEAGKKIALTEQNLQRVEDVLGEVQRQMNVMKRQAAKARRYKEMMEELKRLELTLYSNSYLQLIELSREKTRSTDELAAKEAQLAARLARCHSEIESIQQEAEEKDEAVLQARQAFQLLKERVNKQEAQASSLIKEIEIQQQMEDRLTKERSESKARIAAHEQEKKLIVERIASSKQKASEVENDISLRQMRIDARRKMLLAVRQEYEKARDILATQVNRETGLAHESGYLNKLLSQASDSRSRLLKELDEIADKTKALSAASDRKTSIRESYAERLTETDDIISEEKIKQSELDQIRKRTEAELKAAETDLQIRKARLGSLRTMADNFEGLGAGVRTIMKARDLEPFEKGSILGLVADFIRVDAGYEQAVEAALGEKLQWVMVKSQEDGRQATVYLKEKGKGKGSFVPEAEIKDSASKSAPSCEFPHLKDIIEITDHKEAIEALIGRVFVTEGLEQAIAAWNRHGRSFSYVTPDGDLLDSRGIITGGRLSASSFSLLARRREMESLSTEITALEKKSQGIRGSLEEITDRIEGSIETINELTEQRWKIQEEITEADKFLFRIGEQWAQQEKLASRIKDDLARKDKEEGKSKETLERLKGELKEAQNRRQEQESILKAKENELKEAEAEYDELREDLTRVKSSQNVFKEEQKGLLRESERIERFIGESIKRSESLNEEIENCKERCIRCRRESEELRKQMEGVFEKLRKAEEALRESEHERQLLLNSIKEKEGDAGRIRSEADALKEEMNKIRMAQAEVRFKMEATAKSVRERWDIKIEDIYSGYLADDFSQPEVEAEIAKRKELKDRLGDVNLMAIKEHAELEERYQFMVAQKEDLVKSIESLRLAIKKINQTSLEKFTTTFKEVDIKLKEVFPVLFNGGTAGLALTDESSPLESGVLVQVQLPGKRVSHMGLLSGGEKALAAMALLFAIYMIKPSPFCLLDEVDAPLDEANVDRFNNLLREIKRSSQIIMVTHKRKSMEITDRLYGITMEKIGISKVVSVDMTQSASQPNPQTVSIN
ncbi:MAG: chromosome segregation protein SMC [Deltaproteobacteria bacterium CG_4_9_14_3_um_filter_51_14]|nr:MAG: chromosome segregation protein SMC [Deltaproteobacteria bacterium CG_4_9_14_3_um_filter_51_14]